MSVYKFPGATEQKLENIGILLEQLLANNIDPQGVEKVIAFITYAYSCSIVETILTSSEIQRIHPYDPALVVQIKEALNDCH